MPSVRWHKRKMAPSVNTYVCVPAVIINYTDKRIKLGGQRASRWLWLLLFYWTLTRTILWYGYSWVHLCAAAAALSQTFWNTSHNDDTHGACTGHIKNVKLCSGQDSFSDHKHTQIQETVTPNIYDISQLWRLLMQIHPQHQTAQMCVFSFLLQLAIALISIFSFPASWNI